MAIPARAPSVVLLVGLWAAVGSAGAADRADAEIEQILAAVGRSGCTFVRNGTPHSAPDAEDHLRMKFRKGARYVKTAEDFIDRLASASSWTGKPYRVQCRDQPETTASAC